MDRARNTELQSTWTGVLNFYWAVSSFANELLELIGGVILSEAYGAFLIMMQNQGLIIMPDCTGTPVAVLRQEWIGCVNVLQPLPQNCAVTLITPMPPGV